MTDRIQDTSREDRAIEQAWNRVMATGNEPRLLPGGDDADAGLVREYTELLGLLPYELDSETVPARLEKQILEQAAGAREPAPRAEADASESPVASFPPSAAPVRSRWGGFAIAAAFAACLVGMGFLGGLVWKQSQVVGQMRDDFTASVKSYENEITGLSNELRIQQSRMEMVTTIARKAYPMRTVAQDASGESEGPEGIVYVCGRHQQWYLNLHGLPPLAEGDAYRLWFMTEEGKVDGGVLEVRPDSSSEMEALSMPPDTHGFEVALERQALDGPESRTILLGENAISL
ncbi:MAG: anti-sigma factor [bacterium]|nr:anti-sigma factor [bacterium]